MIQKKIQAFLLTTLLAVNTFTAEPMAYIYHQPESPHDVRYNYHWEVLRAALDRTSQEYGDYTLTASKLFMNERRQVLELEKEEQLTIMARATTKDLENRLFPVRIPVDRGLLGYRVFLIQKAKQPLFDSVKTIDDLRSYSVGQDQVWGDVAVWNANGFHVSPGGKYENLFRMTAEGRFDFFSRGITEIIEEYEVYKEALPNLHIEERIIVYYPWPMYFYFAPSPQGKKLAERVEKGLELLIKEKEVLNSIFYRYYREPIQRLKLNTRTLIRLENPILSKETPLDKKEYWYDPFHE